MAEINSFLSKDALSQIEKYKADLKELNTQYGNLAKSLKTLDGETKKVAKDQKDLDGITIEGNKLLKQRDSLAAKQNKTVQDLTKQTLILKEAEKKRIATLKEEITGEKRSAEIKKLRADAAKRLAAETKKQTTGVKNLIKKLQIEIKTENQATEQNKRLLAVRKDIDTTTAIGAKRVETINKKIDINNKLLKNNASELGKQKIGIGAYNTATTKTNALIEDLSTQFTAMGGTLGNVSGKFNAAIAGVKGLGAQFVKLLKNPIVLTLSAITLAIVAIGKSIANTQGFQDKWNQGLAASNAAVNVLQYSLINIGRGGLKGFNDRLDDAIEKSIELTRAQQSLTKAQISTIRGLNQYIIKEEAWRSIADDATLSFQKREKFLDKAEEAGLKRAALQESFAESQAKITRDQLALASESDKNFDELERKAQEANVAWDNSIAERVRTERGYNKLRRELALDDFEQQLDFIFDVGDKRKTANEKLIADESLTAAQRIAILNDTNRILNESFDDQIGLFESENKLQIDRNKLLTLNNKESFEYARGLGLSERATNRLLEVIRERIAATSDMDEAQKSLNESILKGREDEISLTNNLVDNEKQLAESTLTISKEITEGRKVQYDKDLQYAKDNAQAKIDLNKQVLDSSVSATQEVGNILFDLGQSQLDRQLETIGTEYNARILAAEGNKEAQERLTEDLVTKQNEIKKQQAKSERNQALFNIALNTFQGISAAVAASPLTFGLPFSAFVGLIGAAQAAAVASQPLPQFFMGTSDTPFTYTAGEKGSELMIKQDGSVELTPNKTTLYSGKEYEHAQIIPNKQTQEILANKASGESNRELLKEMRLTRKAIERSSPSIHFSRNVGKLNQRHFNRQYKRN